LSRRREVSRQISEEGDRWTDHRGMARQRENARSVRWFGAASVFGLSGVRHGIDMHEFIETVGGIETD
jgi:hypothetical protein